MNKQLFWKIVTHGLLQWIILNFTLFVVALIVGIGQKAEMTAPPPYGFIILAVVMAAVAMVFGKRLSAGRRQTIIAGAVWSGMTIVFMGVTTIANGTQGVIFGNWGAYIVLVSQVAGTMFVVNRPPLNPQIPPA